MKAELSKFDSDWFGVRVARTSDTGMLIDSWPRENRIDCMCLLLPSAAQREIQDAEDYGALFMDVRVTLERATGAEMSVARPWIVSDVEPLAEIARTAFRGPTRFYADAQFADSRCDELYENWLRESIDGLAEEVLVVEDSQGPAGFVTIHADREVSIGLIAVAERLRGKGAGTNLTRAAVNWGCREGIADISVVTQGCNIPAQRAFQRAGFVTRQTDVWLHKWYE